ncbi:MULTISPECIES: gp16 family protein [Pseudomonadota]|uniref:Regulatory protein GemA n=2 Tax=Bacteria TaxID=2 RepID=A0ABD7G4G0_AERHY|nr:MULTISPECIES: regulatory protein GemA [Gammaproteobacteria]ELQ8315449.1 regulatory protein GemA [Pseudomonas aeruginosa]MCU3413392.1 regulatory protein GemA [Enterobacter hormaechei subsp. steigerwaltii]RCF46460.1 regulatory protein GemA [Aeromonas hydrophila]
MKSAARTAANQDARQRLIRLIHVGKRELGLDDEIYRALLMGSVQKDSTSAMSVPELERVLERMKRSGFKVRVKSARPPAQSRPGRPLAQYPEARKVRALWLFLHQLGAVKNPSEEALAAYVKRIAKVDALQWTNGNQTEALIETLKKWAMRYLPGQVREMAQTLSEAIKTGSVTLSDEELTGLRSTVGLAQTRQTFDPMQTAWDALKTALDKREKP